MVSFFFLYYNLFLYIIYIIIIYYIYYNYILYILNNYIYIYIYCARASYVCSRDIEPTILYKNKISFSAISKSG